MDYWGNKIHITEEAARRHVAIYASFPSEKRFKLALEFAEYGIQGTRDWIRKNHPEYSELEVRLEFIRLAYYETGKLSDSHWQHCQSVMTDKIRKDWAARFRQMMAAKNWTYDDVARWGRFKSGKVVEATISRGLPAFAKLAVVVFEGSEGEQKSPS